ncbi:PREDICTED: uncharacterized protein LOC105568378, partial [Vollenhovia emeryi]|uniref:uncharacterized protein LOC105568378 n=1 Tax=Vollenhovia emeryi TaxID=411798 RepID=UPI0005F4E214
MSTDHSVVQLKEILRAKGLPLTGNKADLVLRLQENDPDALGTAHEGDGLNNSCGTDAGAVQQSENLDRELEHMRRERDLLRCELELMRREADLRNRAATSDARSPSMSDFGGSNIRSLRDLLSEFDGTGNEFWKWKQQVELLRDTYGLDDNAMRMLISSKLKGKALSWFHSKPEHITSSTVDLLKKMKQMFDHRPSKMALRRDFERRVWQTGESFSEYYHSKVILANRVPIEAARPSENRFKEAADLIEAFESVTLRCHTKFERSNVTKGQQKPIKETKPTTAESAETNQGQRKLIGCFNCGGTGHRAADCRKPRVTAEGNVGQRATETGSSAEEANTSKLSSEMNLIQPTIGGEPYLVPKMAIGLVALTLKILGIFEGSVRVDGVDVHMRFFVVPETTMNGTVLLGRDFTSNPAISIIINQTFKISRNVFDAAAETDSFVDQIMHIDCGEQLSNRVELKINPGVSHDAVNKLTQIYNDAYLTKVEFESPISEPEIKICVKHEQPISFRARRVYAEKEKLRVILDDLIEDGVIRESNSPHASPIVLVRKKDGNLRLCVDYRELNKITVKDNFPTPMIDDHLDHLKRKKIYSCLDLKNGFHHIKVAESSVKYTSFITPLGQYEYLKMPFGLTNAPRVFQRYVYNVFRSLIAKNKVLIYMDDILVATEEMEEHLDILREVLVFGTARRHGLRFRLDKCSFLYSEIVYLRYSISESGIQPSAANIESVVNYPVPRNTKQ